MARKQLTDEERRKAMADWWEIYTMRLLVRAMRNRQKTGSNPDRLTETDDDTQVRRDRGPDHGPAHSARARTGYD